MISIEQAIGDLQSAAPDELGLVIAYLAYLEHERPQPDKKLLRELRAIADHKRPHEEHIALYQRNAHQMWTETLFYARQWARETLNRSQSINKPVE